ncbi:hypothetical protein [Thiocystis violascens]|uniref:hypothetical protein n=1 Tax=Thiocystis violascens TaxID=73141 RepID=UPI00022C09AD|nr:hypothetical protein [Thiocystis violascens]
MAGELAIEWGILPWPEGEALDAAAIAYTAWKEQRGKGQTETRQILQAIADFIARHGDSRFSALHPKKDDDPTPYGTYPKKDDATVYNRAGWWKDNATGECVYLFTPAGLREASEGFDVRRVLDALDDSGWIAERDTGKRSKKPRRKGDPKACTPLHPRRASNEPASTDPAARDERGSPGSPSESAWGNRKTIYRTKQFPEFPEFPGFPGKKRKGRGNRAWKGCRKPSTE